ncbi:pentapeptide repeat-containing protein [Nocardia amikacinitolerans]|uniref:pentapeptide repeat-containing protein n=1 Tax=Nocardia amikacinitolerans TaxID=756689 RepID=UPI0036B78F46
MCSVETRWLTSRMQGARLSTVARRTLLQNATTALVRGATSLRAVLIVRGGVAIRPGADLVRARLHGIELPGADLTGADLTSADLRQAYLVEAILVDAELAYAQLADADLRGADLTGADLTRVDAVGTDFSEAEIPGIATAKDLTWSETTRWGEYSEQVRSRSCALGGGRYRLNP